MPIRITQRFIALSIAALSMSLMVASCSRKTEESSAAYQAACQGPPLRTVELRNKAMEDGYGINREYDCIDKASFVAVNEQRAKWEAANTPEAIAKREAEFAEKRARYAEQRAREAAAEESSTTEALPNVVLRNTDVNTATEADIANVISVGPEVAAQIIGERNKRRFNDWADLVNRVIGLSAAQTAVYASICGLNVDGKSLDGAPPNAAMAASISKKYQQYQKK
jgi:DNA uptake protein ComE-like DNA-binding protein